MNAWKPKKHNKISFEEFFSALFHVCNIRYGSIRYAIFFLNYCYGFIFNASTRRH